MKMWTQADRSGPLRAGNIVEVTHAANTWLKAAETGRTIEVEVFESPATGFDADTLELLKACAFGRCPDLYVASHTWIGGSRDRVTPWTSNPLASGMPGPSRT